MDIADRRDITIATLGQHPWLDLELFNVIAYTRDIEFEVECPLTYGARCTSYVDCKRIENVGKCGTCMYYGSSDTSFESQYCAHHAFYLVEFLENLRKTVWGIS